MRQVGTTLLLTGLAATLASGCADKRPPVFAGDAEIEVAEATADSLRVRWPAATDDHEVKAYRVFRDDDQVAELGADRREFTLRDLHGGTDYLVGVVPVDTSDNPGERLSIVATTGDGDPPQFAAGARLRVRDQTSEEEGAAPTLRFEWPAATDENAIGHYRLMREGETVESFDGETTEYTLVGQPGEELDGAYAVVAEDAAGNVSDPLVARYPELSAPTVADATPPTIDVPVVPTLGDRAPLRLNPGLSRALSPGSLGRLRLLRSPALTKALVPQTAQPAEEPQQ